MMRPSLLMLGLTKRMYIVAKPWYVVADRSLNKPSSMCRYVSIQMLSKASKQVAQDGRSVSMKH